MDRFIIARTQIKGKILIVGYPHLVQVRINLLEQEVGELSDAQTVHRVKDQYETIIGE